MQAVRSCDQEQMVGGGGGLHTAARAQQKLQQSMAKSMDQAPGAHADVSACGTLTPCIYLLLKAGYTLILAQIASTTRQ